jgi:anaerobic selenocysteine-containing dehydrogenase
MADLERGKVVKLKGDPDYYTKGFFCDRGGRFIEHLYHPDRLNHPMKRIGERGQGKWKRISWDQALDEIAEKLGKIKERYGVEALAGTGGTARGSHETFKERFMYLFGSPNRGSTGQFCRMVTRQVQSAIYGADIAPMRPAEVSHGCNRIS